MKSDQFQLEADFARVGEQFQHYRGAALLRLGLGVETPVSDELAALIMVGKAPQIRRRDPVSYTHLTLPTSDLV